MADRPQMFAPTRDGRFNGSMQKVVGPTLVAMATTFGLGAEIQSPTLLFVCLSVTFCNLHWINSNPNTDPNPNPNYPSVPVY